MSKKSEEMPNIEEFFNEASSKSLEIGQSQQAWLDWLKSVRDEVDGQIQAVESEIANGGEEYTEEEEE